MLDSKTCYHCKEVKPLSKFRVNNKKYKIASDKGVCLGCIECTEDKGKVKDRIMSKYSSRNQDWWKDES